MLQVYAVDVAFTTGDGKPKDKGLRTTVYKRIIDHKYGLKVKASRTFFNEVNKRFPTFPFSLRYISDEKNARLGTYGNYEQNFDNIRMKLLSCEL